MYNSVPERWLKYKPYGEAIKGTKILTFKVPLRDMISNNLKPKERFTPKLLLQAFPHLKYIIDLTNTNRYYDKKEFTSAGVRYQKILIPGRKVPPIESVKKFFKAMDNFRSACGEGELIGVHCTHGVNRTGYLICRYLIQQLGWEIQESVKAFEEARGYPIEREAYVTALKETPRGEKIDTSKITLTSSPSEVNAIPVKKLPRSALKHSGGKKGGYPMGPPAFVPPRRGFANDVPFPPQHFGFGGPPPGPFGPMPPPPGMPPILPPPCPPMYGPRPHRYGPPMRPAMPPPPPPPGPGFPSPGFSPRMPGPLSMAGPSRLPPGPPARLPPSKMPPPVRPAIVTRLRVQKKKQHMGNDIAMPIRNSLRLMRPGGPTNRIPKLFKEQDFTVDTFEENLLTTSTTLPQRRPMKGRFHQTK